METEEQDVTVHHSAHSSFRAVVLSLTLCFIAGSVAFVFGQAAQRGQAGQAGQARGGNISQPLDADFAERVSEWTTRPEFLSPLVDHLPAVDGVPSPIDVLGHHVGAPRELTYYAQMIEYYEALADASPRVTTMSIGRTDEDRNIVVVAIGSAETIAELPRNRDNLGRLADPRGLTESGALEIIEDTKPIYHLMARLHSEETGPPEMLMELAYRLAVEEGPLFDQIRNNLIVTITPAAEPDGRDRYVDWYYRHLIDIADDRDRITGPPYWGKYIFHIGGSTSSMTITETSTTRRSQCERY